jgi:hypothetical protein
MASRILTCVSCTLYFSFLVTLTAIGLISIVVGFIGLGLYIPTFINSKAYTSDTCSILDHDYDPCQQQNDTSDTSCYSVVWSVEYTILVSTSERHKFSTITQNYDTSVEALDNLRIYKVQTNHTCYYLNAHTTDVQWDEPKSPRPYLIMMTVGFGLAAIYFIVIGCVAVCRCRRH